MHFLPFPVFVTFVLIGAEASEPVVDTEASKKSSTDDIADYRWPRVNPAGISLVRDLSGELDASSFKNVVVIPDIHGDRLSFIHSLWMAFADVDDRSVGLVTFRVHMEHFESGARDRGPLSKNPSDTILVQLGDIIDRGPYGLECLRILDLIEVAIGWKTVRLYGNHEILSHRGKSGPYIHPDEVTRFTSHFHDPKARVSEFAKSGSLWKRITDSSVLMARIGPTEEQDRDNSGILPLTSSSTLFVHGGIDTHWVDQAESMHEPNSDSLVEIINDLAREVFSNPDSDFSPEVFESRSSPVWTRDLAEMDVDYVCKRLLPRVLKRFDVARIIVGHTPQYDRQMKSLCGSRIILADATMSRWMFPDPKFTKENPTVLVMRQFEGSLTQMEALYLDHHRVNRQLFFRKDKGGIDFNPRVDNVRGAIRVQITGKEYPGGRSIYPVDVEMNSVSQRLQSRFSFDLITEIRTVKPLHSFGLPLVTYQSPYSDTGFFVVYDTFGPSLTELGDMTIGMRRQVLESLLDIWESGYTVETPPKNPLDMFILDATTLLVKFVDFGSLTKQRWNSDIHSLVGPVVSALYRVRPGDSSETISHLFLCEEVFDDAISLSEINSKYLSSLRKLSSGASSSSMSDDWDFVISAEADFDDHEKAEIKALGIELNKLWGISSITAVTSSATGSIYTVSFPDHATLNMKRGVVVDVTYIRGIQKAFPALVQLTTNEEAPSIPKLAGVKHRDDGGFFVLWNIDPIDLAPIHEIDDSVHQKKVASNLLTAVSFVHDRKVLFGFEDPLLNIQQMFFVHKRTGAVLLIDVSALTLEVEADESLFNEEKSAVVSALRQAFVGIEIPCPVSPSPRSHTSGGLRRRESIDGWQDFCDRTSLENSKLAITPTNEDLNEGRSV